METRSHPLHVHSSREQGGSTVGQFSVPSVVSRSFVSRCREVAQVWCVGWAHPFFYSNTIRITLRTLVALLCVFLGAHLFTPPRYGLSSERCSGYYYTLLSLPSPPLPFFICPFMSRRGA